ncbi:MAG: sugar transferase [Patescibacteria group bacterium]
MKNGPRILLLLLGDVLMLGVSFYAMIHIAFYGQVTSRIIGIHALPFTILSLTWITIFFIFNLYDPQATRPTIPHLRRIFFAFIVAAATGAIFFYTIPFFGITPKTNLLIFSLGGIIFFIVWRRIFYSIFSFYFRKRVAFLVSASSTLPQINELANYMQNFPQSGFIVDGIYSSLPELDSLHKKELPAVYIVSKEIWRKEESFRKLHEIEGEVLDLAYAYEDILSKIPIEAIDEGWFMHNIRSQDKNASDQIKKVFGALVAIILVIITSPLFLLIAIAIKISGGGPILYSQTRVGKNDKTFRLHKFRSMIPNAEKNGPEWSAKNDPRVTPVGRVMRKLHVDELPQLFNIIKGDIALVGPRPERPEFVEKLEKEIPYYHLRHTIAPGFTGWAQIKFRYAGNVMDSKEKFEYDLYYLKNRNIFMDLGIFLRTLQIIFTH